ncbi:MAG: hypothetical protein ACK442_10250 [Novosphingobium sp.]|jgi:hypothetical protein|nr:hypothetical protein [Brevundimonas sp.]MCZ8322628.1 hypothetical protein [Novosphingobium sp.]
MDSQNTDLERQVLAHARILQTLIRYLAEDRPSLLERLMANFGCDHTLGRYEQDFCSTEQHGERFLHIIEQEILRVGGPGSANDNFLPPAR